MNEPLGLLLMSGTHERAHYAFVLAAAAAAVGRTVVVFATNAGCLALLEDWHGLDGSGRDAVVQSRGVAGLDELRGACTALGVEMLACEAGLRAEQIDRALLMSGATVAGVTTFLAAVRGGQVLTL